MTENSFDARATLGVGGREYVIYRLDALQSRFDVARLPFSLKVLLENLLRTEDGVGVRAQDIEALATWVATDEPSDEIAFTPARVLMQDFTGVPAVVDLAAMRDAMAALGGDPEKINPLVPAELVIDHSVQVDVFGSHAAFERNAELEFERNRERYAFLRWGQGAFDGFKVVPPDTGIVHQVNLEYLARVVFVDDDNVAYPDTLVGTDSHTTMVNGLGVLGWGVGGIEAEAAMLGQPLSMLIPHVLGFRLKGALPEGATATDLVLTVTERLRGHGVVGKFVEFYGPGVGNVPLADRATIGNMSPEYGSTCAIFPIDEETLRYMTFSGRPAEQVELVEAYAREQGLWHDPDEEPTYTDTIELDLGEVEPSLAGPRRPQDRVALSEARERFREAVTEHADLDFEDEAVAETFPASDPISFEEPANGEGPRTPFPEPPRRPAARGHRAQGPGDGHLGAGRGRRGDLQPRPRRRRHRRHHQLHEHVEPRRDDRRRPAGAQRRRPRARGQAVGEDLARARLQGGHGVLREGRPRARAGGAALPPRRLRLHDLHRQLRPAGGGDLGRGRGGRARGGLGALRQPELRGPHQPRREDELPGLAAAGGRLRAGRDHERRPGQRSARPGPGRRARLPARHLALLGGGRARGRGVAAHGHVPRPPTRRSSTATSAGPRWTCPRATASPGTPTPPTCASRRTSSTSRGSPSRSRTSAARACWPSSATASPPTTSRPRARSRRPRPPART